MKTIKVKDPTIKKVDIVLDGKSARELERRQFTVGDLKKLTKKIK